MTTGYPKDMRTGPLLTRTHPPDASWDRLQVPEDAEDPADQVDFSSRLVH